MNNKSNLRNNLNNAINKTLKFLQEINIDINSSNNNLYSNSNLYSEKNLTNENLKLKKRNMELKNKYEILKNSLNFREDNGANINNYVTSENDSLYNNLAEKNNELKRNLYLLKDMKDEENDKMYAVEGGAFT